MKRIVLLSLALAFLSLQGKDIKKVRRVGPFSVTAPVLIDSVDAGQQKYSKDKIIETPLVLSQARSGKIIQLPDSTERVDSTTLNKQLMLAAFSFRALAYTKAEVKVSGPKSYKVYINNKEVSGKRDYERGQYDVVVKYVSDTAALRLELQADSDALLKVVELEQNQPFTHPFSMHEVMEMRHYTALSLSPSGKYATYSIYWTDSEGKNHRLNRLIEMQSGRLLSTAGYSNWMPKTDRLLTTRQRDGQTALISINPQDMSEEVLCAELPSQSYVMSPTEDFLILYKTIEGPKRENGVYEILTPDDRQPGWRNRTQLLKLDLKTGLTQPLTYGNKATYLSDIAPDGKSIIYSVSERRLEKRPTSLTTYCQLNLETMQVDTLILRDGFINSVSYIPGTQKLAIVGSAEAFDRAGCILPDSLTPNVYEHQMFLYDLSTRSLDVSIAKKFVPSIESVVAAQADGIVFFTAENADSVSLYRLDAKTGKIQMIDQPLEDVFSLAVASEGNTLLYSGCSACVSDKLYTLNTKSLKVQEIDDCNKEFFEGLEIGTCHPLAFKSERGYTLTGHYYLPANFDKDKKYPVIVHYYGGCSPTSRRYGGGGHYPAHYWNAQGYIVLICNPSGAAGFGQEWGARHVNTMGEGVAEDIIETVKYFSDQNGWVDSEKIGCVSASYGGFMTQLLLTKSDMFAAGISHAGISDHTSYWGEGYWGYSYSQVSAANSYPWTRKDLYVDRSPLYNADKIHTPILFTHGTADTNVPIGESIQMYTALKLLGVETAFVMVEGENHGIMDFHKRQKWINTMVAWFDKHLKGEDSWWKAIYTPKEL